MTPEQGVISALASGCYEEALQLLVEALASDPQRYDLLCLQGYVHQHFAHYAEASASYAKAIALSPPSFELQHNMGLVCRELGQPGQARGHLEAALRMKPEALDTLDALASVLNSQGDLSGALLLYERILAIDPRHVATHLAMAETFAEYGWEDEAMRSYQAALDIDRDCLDAANGLAAMNMRAGRYAEARHLFAQALTQSPGNLGLMRNLALLHLAQGDISAVEGVCAEALRLHPGDPDLRFTLGTARLLSGRLREGWVDYECRWQSAEKVTAVQPLSTSLPRWQGEPVDYAASGIVLHAEQGFGDSIQFARFVPQVAERFGKVCLKVPVLLHSLFQRSFAPWAEVVSETPDDAGYTHHCPLMSLALAFDTLLETIPSAVPYLIPDAQRVAEWHKKTGVLTGLKVGLVWATGKRAMHRNDFDVPPAMLEPLLAVSGVHWISLNKVPLAEAQKSFLNAAGVIDWTNELISFDDTAALMASLDLVISVDTATAHLAGALGRSVWLLNRAASEWRWLLERSDSPWYPTMRIFRQKTARQWGTVISEVTARLQKLVEERA